MRRDVGWFVVPNADGLRQLIPAALTETSELPYLIINLGASGAYVFNFDQLTEMLSAVDTCFKAYIANKGEDGSTTEVGDA